MVSGIRIELENGTIKQVSYTTPFRSSYMVIFNHSGNTLLWEPNEIKATKVDMKKYISEVNSELSKHIGSTNVLAYGQMKYEHVEDNVFDIDIGGTIIGRVYYADDTLDTVGHLEYKPKFINLTDVPNFI